MRRALLCACFGLALVPASGSAATINVTTQPDVLSNMDGLCSLREAVFSANANGGPNATGCTRGSAGSLDTIRLTPGGTYQLAGSIPTAGQEEDLGFGDLEIDDAGPVQIETAAAGAPATIDAGDRDRALQLLPGADVLLLNLRIVNGTAALGGAGGGLRVDSGELALDRVEVSGNVAATSGGGLSVSAGGTLEVADSVVSGNGISASGQNVNALGGGIHNDGSAEIERTDIADNDIFAGEGFTIGGGLYNSGTGVATVRGSVIRDHSLSGNTSAQFGGGIGNDGELSVVNSTIADNLVGSSDLTGQGGAGIYSTAPGSAEIRHTTIHGNGAFMPGEGDALRGDNFEVSGSLLGVGNSDVVCAVSSGLVSGDDNVVFGDTCALNAPNDLHLDDPPAIAGLADNGGPTPSSAIPVGSPAVDHVPTAHCRDLSGASLSSDQRGASRPHGSACDAGAYELTSCSGEVVNSDPSLGAGCPLPMTLDFTPAAANSLPPFISIPSLAPKRCKKGQKLKRGKCVKKRKKRKRP